MNSILKNRLLVIVNLLSLLFFTSDILSQRYLSVIPCEKSFAGVTAHPVARVIDGDTFVINADGKEVTIRLIGVDTPETVHPQKPIEVYGKEASRFSTNLLIGEAVYLEFEQGTSNKDKYGRTLAYAYRAPDGLFINLEIIRQGYGHAYTKYPFQYMDLFRSYESKARQAKKGLWGDNSAISEKTTIPATSNFERTTNDSESTNRTQENTVYITLTGTKYHQAHCRYLRKSIMPISLIEAKQRYTACSVCMPPQ